MSESHRGLLILSLSDEGGTSKLHDDFAEMSAVKLLKFMNYVIEITKETNTCAPCALLSMTSTLMGNIFLLFEAQKTDSSGDLSELFHDMVDHSRISADKHRKSEENANYAENKLDSVYSLRKKRS